MKFGTRVPSPSFPIWEDYHPSSRSRLEVINEHLQLSRRLGRIAGVSSALFTMTRDLVPSLAAARRTVTVPTQSLLACWCMDVLRLLRMASRNLLRTTKAFRPLPARLLTPSLSFMRFLIACTVVCGILTRFTTSLTLCPAQRSAEMYTWWSRSLRSNFEIYNNNKPFPSMSQSQSIGCVKQEPDNNCQTTRIVANKILFSPPGIYLI